MGQEFSELGFLGDILLCWKVVIYNTQLIGGSLLANALWQIIIWVWVQVPTDHTWTPQDFCLGAFLFKMIWKLTLKLEIWEKIKNLRKNWKQEGAELCQAQPAKHKLFGSNGAIFLVWIVDGWNVELLNCWIVELLNCWFVELLNG